MKLFLLKKLKPFIRFYITNKSLSPKIYKTYNFHLIKNKNVEYYIAIYLTNKKQYIVATLKSLSDKTYFICKNKIEVINTVNILLYNNIFTELDYASIEYINFVNSLKESEEFSILSLLEQ